MDIDKIREEVKLEAKHLKDIRLGKMTYAKDNNFGDALKRLQKLESNPILSKQRETERNKAHNRAMLFLYDELTKIFPDYKQITFSTDLNDKQLYHLFEALKKNKYISKDSDISMCVWAFGGKNIPTKICEDFYKRNEQNYDLWYSNRNDYTINLFKDYVDKYYYFNPIVWMKTKEERKNGQINKKSILDLLMQLGLNKGEIQIIKELPQIHLLNTNEPVKFNRQNHSDFIKTNFKSEFHEEIKKFIQEAKLIK